MDEVYEHIFNMSNKEAAFILKNTLISQSVARQNGKTVMATAMYVALAKAIKLLEETPG